MDSGTTGTDVALYLTSDLYTIITDTGNDKKDIYSVTMSQQILVRGRKQLITQMVMPDECMYRNTCRDLCDLC